MGDFNSSTMHEISCTLAQEQEFINLFSTLHYYKLINLPTRITQKSSSFLDNIYTPLPYHNSSKGVLISDTQITILRSLFNMELLVLKFYLTVK